MPKMRFSADTANKLSANLDTCCSYSLNLLIYHLSTDTSSRLRFGCNKSIMQTHLSHSLSFSLYYIYAPEQSFGSVKRMFVCLLACLHDPNTSTKISFVLAQFAFASKRLLCWRLSLIEYCICRIGCSKRCHQKIVAILRYI